MFKLQIVSEPQPQTENFEEFAVWFFRSIGYLSNKQDKDSLPYRVFEIFLKHQNKVWHIDELKSLLNATPPAIYRYINILKDMELLESVKNAQGKGYRLRYCNFAKAWEFVDTSARVALDSYKKVALKLQELLMKQ